MKNLSEASIGRALGISPASVTKCKNMAMPVYSVEAARTWRHENITPTMHRYVKYFAEAAPTEPHQSGAVAHALGLMDIASAALTSGKPIDALVPTLRAALAAVPIADRSGEMLLPVNVMEVLTAEVFALLPHGVGGAAEDTLASHDDTMSDHEAEDMGRFRY